MYLKITFALCLWCLLAAYQYANAAAVDDNAIVDLTMENYFAMLNASGTPVGCCPRIVRPGPKGSVIQPFSGWRGNVALIVDWGTCTIDDKGFLCGVNWGDGGHGDIKYLQDFGPCQIVHQYPKVDASYTVTAFYCGPAQQQASRCCRTLVRTIDVSFDPGKISFEL